jgi:flavin reductase (DIM6/NTAB) family NADH-FMN oxidoreductase RutF
MLRNGGLLLTSIGSDGKPNVMTNGWGLIGTLWRKPVYMVAVRKSRYTHTLMEDTGDFTVNVPKNGMRRITNYCGTVSGRDYDKFKEAELTPIQGRMVKAPSIEECIIHYECRTIGKLELSTNTVSKEILSEIYPSDAEERFHTLYFGEILSTYAEKDAKKKLGVTVNP